MRDGRNGFRWLAGLGLFALLAAVPASAIIVGKYSGHVKGDRDATVAFDVKRGGNGGKRVTGFTIFNVPYNCVADPAGRTQGHRFIKSIRIRPDGRFSKKGEWTTPFADPQGKVTGVRHGPNANGTFRIRGDLAGVGSDCKTGLQDWKATKGDLP